MEKKEFGRWLKKVRDDNGMKQKELAAILYGTKVGDTDTQNLANWERTGNFPKKLWKTFIQYFQMNPEDFTDIIISIHRTEIEKIIFQKDGVIKKKEKQKNTEEIPRDVLNYF